MTQSVLAHVAASFSQKENLATEALAFILNRSSQARDVIAAELRLLGVDKSALVRVETQAVVGEESRPDLMLRGADGSPIAFIEAKFWAALTESQPVEYLRRLEANGGGALIMLAPERRLPSLRAEVRTRCGMLDALVIEEGGSSCVLRFGKSAVGFVSWNHLLSAVSRAVVSDHAVSSDVSQLRGLCSKFEAEGLVPLTRVDIDNLDVPRQALALGELGMEVVGRATELGVLSTRGLRPRSDINGAGRYAAFEYAGCWLGLHYRQWALRGLSPLWVRFAPTEWGRAHMLHDILRELERHDPPLLYREDDGWLSVPLQLPTGTEKPRVIEVAIERLRELDRMMKLANMPPLRGAAPTVDE